MKTARTSSKSISRQLSKKGKLTTVSLFSAFALGSLALGFLIWKMNDPSSLAATDASANQKNIIECKDTIRDGFDNNLRVGRLFRVAGDYPEGVFASNGLLRLRSSEGKSAQLLLVPQIKGNFTYQTRFEGMNAPEGNFIPFSEINVTVGDAQYLTRIRKTAQGNDLVMHYSPGVGQQWQSKSIGSVPNEFKYRVLRRKNKVMVMVKDVGSKDPFKVIYQHDIAEPDGLAKITLLSNALIPQDASSKGVASTARYENFRVFCPSEIENEWVKDDES